MSKADDCARQAWRMDIINKGGDPSQMSQGLGPNPSKAPMKTAELFAKTFCEASGLYKWDDTHGSLREWYLQGSQAVIDRWIIGEPEPPIDPKFQGPSIDYAAWRKVFSR